MEHDDEIYISYGGEVKALEGGKVAGYLVRFTTEDDPDLSGEYFTKDTDYGDIDTPRVLYHHGQDTKVGKRPIGRGQITRNDVGLWLEAQLELRDEYEKAIYEMAQQSKLGWSSGTAGHLVERQRTGKSVAITAWPIIEASLTPTPAEPRNGAIALKSLLPETSQQQGAGSTRDAVAVSVQTNTHTERETTMNEIDIKAAAAAAVAEALQAERAAAVQAAEIEKQIQAAREEGRREGREDAIKSRANAIESGFNIVNPANLGSDALREMNAQLRDRSSVKTLTTSEGDTPKAGYLVVPQWRDQLIELLGVQSIIRAVGAQVQSNFVGESFKMPYEASGSDATTKSENEEIVTSEPVFAERTVLPYKPTYKVTVTNEALENESYDLLGYIQRRAAKAIAAWENTNFFTGNGSTAPGGVVTRATSVVAAASSAISVDDVVNLLYGMDGAYSQNGVFVMRRATLALIRKLKGDNFQFNVTPLGTGTAAGNGGVYFAETINGRRVHTTQAISAVGSGNSSVVFFDPSEYQVVDWRNLTIMVDPYTEAQYDRVRYIVTARTGGDVLNSEAFVKLTHPTA